MSVQGIRTPHTHIPQYRPQEKQSPHRTVAESPGESVPPKTGEFPGSVLTASEKEFFEDLFPGAKADIRSHNVYRKDGSTPPATMGTMVDRKG
jgi:hypothetical protein